MEKIGEKKFFSCENIGLCEKNIFFLKRAQSFFYILFKEGGGEAPLRSLSNTATQRERKKNECFFFFVKKTRLFFFPSGQKEKKAFAAILNQKLKTSRKYLEVFLLSHNWTQDDDDCMNCMNKK